MKPQQAITLMLKAALEYNAAILAQASIISGEQMGPGGYKKAVKNFRKSQGEYDKQITYLVEKLEGKMI